MKSLLERIKDIAQEIVLAEDEYDRYRDMRRGINDKRPSGDWDDMKDNRRTSSPTSPHHPKAKVRMIKQYLNVPYAEREAAKKMGARWDPEVKKWYMPVFAGTVWSAHGYEHWIVK